MPSGGPSLDGTSCMAKSDPWLRRDMKISRITKPLLRAGTLLVALYILHRARPNPRSRLLEQVQVHKSVSDTDGQSLTQAVAVCVAGTSLRPAGHAPRQQGWRLLLKARSGGRRARGVREVALHFEAKVLTLRPRWPSRQGSCRARNVHRGRGGVREGTRNVRTEPLSLVL